jgi:alkanesulfonate monooxygenase SsuD/methylene tetrahydromethanopterin reductase-like flavin-dependent oxidoreductase (luciferase family)
MLMTGDTEVTVMGPEPPTHVGIQIGATTPPAALPEVVVEAERLGYGEIWLAEDYFELGGVASAALALAATERIPVGLGVVAAAARHPAVTAMEFATLGTAFPGRFLAGVGHGAPGWLRQMGLEVPSPLGTLRESVSAIRALLGGAEVTREGGRFRFDHVGLLHPPEARIPLYLGVHGPASLRLSGELADGTLLGWFSSPGYVAWARERIDEGRARGDRNDHHHLAVLCLLSMSDDDPGAASGDTERWVGPMLAAMTESPQLVSSEEGRELAAIVARQSPPEAGIPRSLLAKFMAVGDGASCAATIAALLEAGADRVALVPNPAGVRTVAEMMEQMRRASVLVGAGRTGDQ